MTAGPPPIYSQPPKKKPWKWIVMGIAAGFLFLCCGGSAIFMKGCHEAVKQQVSPGTPGSSDTGSPPANVIKVDANAVYREYDGNEVAADTKYKDQWLDVTGTVQEIGKDAFDNSYVNFTCDSNQFMSSFHCFFSDAHKGDLAKLTKGQQVTIRGKCAGFVIKTVQLKDCELK